MGDNLFLAIAGPIDLDKQCGVITGEGQPVCARSLTCKTHSMSAKRAVVGRTRPYDELLAIYQARNLALRRNLLVITKYGLVWGRG